MLPQTVMIVNLILSVFVNNGHLTLNTLTEGLKNAYNLNPGPNTAIPNEAKAVDYFKEFWD